MLEIFRELRGLLRVSHVHIDSWVFRLHYSVTTTVMFAFSLIVSAKQYVGNPIDCIHSKDIPEDVLNTYCWIHSTYTIPSAFWKRIGFDVAHPGVDKTLDPEERRYHKYYQWLWKNWEAGKISALRMDLNLGIISEEVKCFCLIDFLMGHFFTYGIEVMSFADRDQEDRIDPMIYVFPRMTKCTFHKFGTSGNIEKHDALCIFATEYFFSPYVRALVLRMRYRRVKRECIDMVIGKSYVGDWFLIYLLGQNIDSVIFKDVLHELAKKLGYRSRDIGET
ncbi:inx [Lepeophtheirus salmonis]|uniref:Innexin n=1 Tax=Lepeophtheirus salmonis TaxID=72036 RepID=A0A7R8CH42_LEPSM|nr:inx [Lepeophtheirus salmonis]CAF2820982.1 inx [Lepeophtheirus salmonis]